MKRVTVKPGSFFHVVILAQIWSTLQKPHLQRTVNVAAEQSSGEATFGKNVKPLQVVVFFNSTCKKVWSGRA